MIEKLKQIREALEYYADADNYEPFNTLGGMRPAPITKMRGKEADVGLALLDEITATLNSEELVNDVTDVIDRVFATAMQANKEIMHDEVLPKQSLESQIDELANFLMKEYPEEIGKDGISEGAIEVAIRVLDEKKKPEECEGCAEVTRKIASGFGVAPLAIRSIVNRKRI